MQFSSGAASYLCRLLGDSALSAEAKLQVVKLARWACMKDRPFRNQLQKGNQSGGFMRQLVALWSMLTADSDQQQVALLQGVATMLSCAGADMVAYRTMVEEMFRSGFIGAMLAILHSKPPAAVDGSTVPALSKQVARMFWSLADALLANERLRDMGLIQVFDWSRISD